MLFDVHIQWQVLFFSSGISDPPRDHGSLILIRRHDPELPSRASPFENLVGMESHREWVGGTENLSRFLIAVGFFFENTLPETNMAPENGWLEYDRFILGWPIFRGYVSFREGRTSRSTLVFLCH